MAVDRTKLMKSALRSILSKEIKELGFVGNLPWFRRLSKDGVDILWIQFRTEGFRLDAGRVPHRSLLEDKTPQEDFAVYAGREGKGKRSTLIKVALHRPGGDWFHYDKGTTKTYFNAIAKSATDIVSSEGVKFWKKKLK